MVITIIALKIQKKRSPQSPVLIHIKCSIPKLLAFHRYFTSHYSWRKLTWLSPWRSCRNVWRGQKTTETGEEREHVQESQWFFLYCMLCVKLYPHKEIYWNPNPYTTECDLFKNRVTANVISYNETTLGWALNPLWLGSLLKKKREIYIRRRLPVTAEKLVSCIYKARNTRDCR